MSEQSRLRRRAHLSLKRLLRYARGTCGIDPVELEQYQREEHLPFAEDREADIRTMFASKLSAGIELVKHEDSLNWSKFYNMAYVNMGLIGAFGLIFTRVAPQREFMLGLIALIGLTAALGFTMTLWSGLCCLDGHKEIVRNLDRHMAGVEALFSGKALPPIDVLPDEFVCESGACKIKPRSIFLGKKGPSRSLLKCAPVGALLLWTLLLGMVATGGFADITPNEKLAGTNAMVVESVEQASDGSSEPSELPSVLGSER